MMHRLWHSPGVLLHGPNSFEKLSSVPPCSCATSFSEASERTSRRSRLLVCRCFGDRSDISEFLYVATLDVGTLSVFIPGLRTYLRVFLAERIQFGLTY